jgi:hypothetical protein
MNDPLEKLRPYLAHDEVCQIPPGPGPTAQNCICGAIRAYQAARAELVSRGETIVCGRTYHNDDAEARTQALRAGQGFPTDGGCGRKVGLTWAYRCAECGRWMHLDCLKQHFKESQHDKTVAPACDASASVTVTPDHLVDWPAQLTAHAAACRHCRMGALGRDRCQLGTDLYRRAFINPPCLVERRPNWKQQYAAHRAQCARCQGISYVDDLCPTGIDLYTKAYRVTVPLLEGGDSQRHKDELVAQIAELARQYRVTA